MSMNKQVFWLRGRSTRFTFLLDKSSGFKEAFVARYSGAHHAGFSPASLFSPNRSLGHLLTNLRSHLHYLVWPFKELYNM
jgi:hypothetical protein